MIKLYQNTCLCLGMYYFRKAFIIMAKENMEKLVSQPKATELINETNSPNLLTSSDDFRTLAQIIKDSRKAHGWTQREFASKLGITQATLCELEKSDSFKQRRPTKRIVLALFPYLDITFDRLITLADYDANDFEITANPSEPVAEKTLKELQMLSPEDLSIFSGIFDIMRDTKNKKALIRTMSFLKSISEGPDNKCYSKSLWERDLIISMP